MYFAIFVDCPDIGKFAGFVQNQVKKQYFMAKTRQDASMAISLIPLLVRNISMSSENLGNVSHML